jgi:predicted nucleic acid-binding protein
MILADSSVWIDFFHDKSTLQVERLVALIQSGDIIVGDLILAEILQGCNTDREFDRVRRFIQPFPVVQISTPTIAIQAARNYRTLRAKGITVRKTIDTLIATRCIIDGLTLLYSDRDFDPFVQELGLNSAMDLPSL